MNYGDNMLKVISLDEAKSIAASLPEEMKKTEYCGICDINGRTAAEDILSAETVPPFDRSTVDGFAVRARDTYGAGESIPAMLKITGSIDMGEETELSVSAGECAKILTGGMLPKGTDAAVMIEHTDVTPDGYCLCYSGVPPFENVTRAGDDTRPGEILIKRGTLMGPRHAGVLAAAGITSVPVAKRPVVSVISTGNELVDASSPQLPGKIRDVNTYLISSLCRTLGCETKHIGIVQDKTEKITRAVLDASENSDIVLISGGSSAGEKDESCKIISSLGEVFAHGIAVKPGKPTVIGKIGRTPVIGLPGHPAAAYFVACTLLRSMLPSMGTTPPEERKSYFPMAVNVSSNHGREEFLCVGTAEGEAVPHPAKSGIISMLSKSDGYIVIDRNREGIKKGETVEVRFFG